MSGMEKPVHRRGRIFKGPDTQGYVLTRDVFFNEVIQPNHLEAFGGAPEPKDREILPEWLAKEII